MSYCFQGWAQFSLTLSVFGLQSLTLNNLVATFLLSLFLSVISEIFYIKPLGVFIKLQAISSGCMISVEKLCRKIMLLFFFFFLFDRLVNKIEALFLC